MKINMPIRVRAALYISVLILFFGLIGTYLVYWQTRRVMLLEKEKTLLSTVIEKSNTIAEKLKLGEAMAKTVATSSEIKQFMENAKIAPSEEMNTYLENYFVNNDFSAIYLMTATGSAVASTDRTFINNDFSFREYFKDAINGSVGREMVVGVISHAPGFYYTAPIIDSKKTIIGVSAVKMNNVPFDSLIKQAETLKLGHVLLIDTDGVVIFSSSSEFLYHTLTNLDSATMNRIVTERKFEGFSLTPLTYGEVLREIRTYKEPKILSIYDKKESRNELISLSRINNSGYFLIFESGYEEIVSQPVMISVVIAGVVMLISIMVTALTVLLINRTLYPLGLLSKTAEEIGKGNFEFNFPIGNDEIGRLSLVLKQMTGRLKENYGVLNQFKLAVENSSTHIIITDPDAKILYANKAVEKLTGYTHGEIMGANPSLWGKQMPTEFYQKMWHQIKEERIPFRGEIINKKKDGTLYHVILTISPILEDGKLLGFVGLEDDISDRIKLEKALKASEEKYRLIVEKSFDVVALVDHAGKIISETPAMFRVLGYTSNERVGQNVFETIHPDDFERVRVDFAQLLMRSVDNPMIEMFRVRHKNGTYRWIEAVGTNALEVPEIKAIIVHFRDVTERKVAEDALNESQEKLSLINDQLTMIYAQTTDILYYIQVENGSKFRFLSANPAFYKATGLTESQVVGHLVSEVIPEPSFSFVVAKYEEAIRNKTSVFWEETTPYPTGVKYGEVAVSPIFNNEDVCTFLVGTVHDVTESKKLQLSLSEEKSKLESTLTSIGDGLIVVDMDGVITGFNPAAGKLLHVDAQKMIGQQYEEVIKAFDEKGKPLDPERRLNRQVLRTGKAVSTSNYLYLREDGTKFAINATVAPIMVDSKMIGLVVIFRDISREREIDRMKTEFISLASHQLRTPLSAIKWFMEILMKDQREGMNEAQIESLRNVNESNERMIALVNSLLNVSRIESGRLMVEPVLTNLAELTEGIVGKFKKDLDDKKISLDLKLKSDLPKILIDDKLISQVITNLLTNSIKYTNEGGKVEVVVEEKDNDLIVKVTDNGLGIPQEEQSRIFVKFYRGSNIVRLDTEGTGLGLYLAKLIIEQSGGKMGFESGGENKGSSFWFTLPKSGMQPVDGTVSLEPIE